MITENEKTMVTLEKPFDYLYNKNAVKAHDKQYFNESLEINGQNFVQFMQHEIFGSREYHEVCHTHPQLEISMIEQGEGTYRIGDKVYQMQPGDIFIINNTEPHGIELQTNQSLVNTVIHFEPRFVWSDPTHFDARFLNVFFERDKSFSHQLDRENPTTIEIQNLFRAIGEEFRKQLSEYDLMVKVKLLNILVLLIRHYEYGRPLDPKPHHYELTIIKKVTDFIDGHFVEDIGLNDLARIASMNPSYFSTFFKKYNGLTPSDYILRKRITQAMSYMKSTDGTVLEIALKSGFNTVANFNKQFKKVTGLTPTVFRNGQNS